MIVNFLITLANETFILMWMVLCDQVIYILTKFVTLVNLSDYTVTVNSQT